MAGNALVPFNVDTVITSEIMRELRPRVRLNNLPRSQRQMPCSFLVHRISERFGTSKAKLRKDGIEAARPPSPSHSALPLPLLPCRGMVYLQASALGSSHGVSLGTLREGKIPSGLPNLPPPPILLLSWRDRKKGWPLFQSGPMYGPLSWLADLNDFLYPPFSPLLPPTASCGHLIKLA